MTQSIYSKESVAQFLQASEIQAVVFDMDGVIVETTSVHAKAWKTLLAQSVSWVEQDYLTHFDGRSRIEGLDHFFQAKGIQLPVGEKQDNSDKTLYGLSNQKNATFRSLIQSQGVATYEDTLQLLSVLDELSIPMGLATSSCNRSLIFDQLEKQNGVVLDRFFRVVIDGDDLQRERLRSKPSPDIFQYAIERLDVLPQTTMIIEDAITGVQAAKGAQAGYVLGVNRANNNQHEEALQNAGADVVVSSLFEFSPLGQLCVDQEMAPSKRLA